jgi:uncharacterized repeat protein (TIGR03803 family)
MKPMKSIYCAVALGLVALNLAGSSSSAPAQSLMPLHAFNQSDGAYPKAGLIADQGGSLYGTTYEGGSGYGTVFQLKPFINDIGQTVWIDTVLHSFGKSDGAYPEAGLIADLQGALYGTTYEGGSNGYGTVFKLTPPANGLTAWTQTVLYNFCNESECSDGAYPLAGLIADQQGALYGTTYEGGDTLSCYGGCGTVFKLTPPAKGKTAWTHAVLSRNDFDNPGDEYFAYPRAGLIADSTGALYGTTYGGGLLGAYGSVFKLTPPANGQTAWTETLLYSFCQQSHCADGSNPAAGLIADKDGALYGTTYYGGIAFGCFDVYQCGTVFKLTPPANGQTAWTHTVLYSFCNDDDCKDGSYPAGGLIADQQGALYGTTYEGGSGYGTIFKLTPPANGQTAPPAICVPRDPSCWTLTVLRRFGNGSDGAYPLAGLFADPQGALYGTTYEGGAGYGTVFKLTLSGQLTSLPRPRR